MSRYDCIGKTLFQKKKISSPCIFDNCEFTWKKFKLKKGGLKVEELKIGKK